MYPRNNAAIFSQSFQLPNTSLEAYFGRVRMGSSKEIRTNFYGKDTPTATVLQSWLPILEEGIAKRWPHMFEFEIDLANKVGPLSIMKPLKDRMDDIVSYYEDISLPQVSISNSAIAAVLREWSNARGLTLRNQDRTVQGMKTSTNSGSPFFTKRNTVIDLTVPTHVYQDAAMTHQVLVDAPWLAAAVLGWRGQEHGPTYDDVKQRVIWMFPFAVNICELQVYQVLIEAAQQYNLVPAWVGMDAVDREVTRLFDTKSRGDLVVCTDFTKFDQHFNPKLQATARELLSGIFNTSIDGWLRDVFPVKYSIPLAYDYGKVFTGMHGMGSGSGGTNADETLAHRALQYEAAIRSGSKLNAHSMCLGDDGILSFPGITEDCVMEAYTSHGLDMNPEKQSSATDHCTYLRRYHDVNYRKSGICVGVYSTCRALGRLCEQERWYTGWSAQQVALRQLSILENIKWHPLRERFVEFCMKGDKFRLGLDLPGFLDNLQAISESSAHFTDYIGYNLATALETKGINSWWIVNYLRSLR